MIILPLMVYASNSVICRILNWLLKGINSFLELSRREGGREGWNALAGLKWEF